MKDESFIRSAMYGLYGWFVIIVMAIATIFVLFLFGKVIELGLLSYLIGMAIILPIAHLLDKYWWRNTEAYHNAMKKVLGKDQKFHR